MVVERHLSRGPLRPPSERLATKETRRLSVRWRRAPALQGRSASHVRKLGRMSNGGCCPLHPSISLPRGLQLREAGSLAVSWRRAPRCEARSASRVGIQRCIWVSEALAPCTRPAPLPSGLAAEEEAAFRSGGGAAYRSKPVALLESDGTSVARGIGEVRTAASGRDGQMASRRRALQLQACGAYPVRHLRRGTSASEERCR